MNDQQPLDLPTVTPGAPERVDGPEPFPALHTAATLLQLVSRVGHDLRAVKFEPINPLDVHGRRTAAGAPLWRVTVQRASGAPLNVIRSSLHAVCVATLEELAAP
jgi:hypothetical protein